MLTLVALAALLQDEVFIPKSGKGPYLDALDKYEAALEASASDAVDAMTSILENSKIEKKECRLKIEKSAGDYKRGEFYPYQLRGRSRMKMAEGADRDKAIGLLEKAVADLEESVRRNVKSSEALLDEAKAQLKKLKDVAPGVDPEPEFRREWNALVSKSRFTAARDHVASKGGVLGAEKQKQYLADTEKQCADFVADAAKRFLNNLEDLRGVRTLTSMRRETFERDFELPPRADLISSSRELDFASALRPALAKIRDGGAALEPLVEQGVAAAAVVEKGENRWFLAIEKLVHEIVYEGIDGRTLKARDAAADQRRVLREECDALSRQWQNFDAKARQAGQANADFAKSLPARNFAPLFERFPVDDDSIKKVAADIQATADAEDPDRALADIEESLRRLRQRFDRLSVEARRTVVTYHIVAVALRGFLSGRTVDDVVRDLRTLGGELRDVGGATDVKAFGPRVGQVLEKLR